jgi:undecaprenyl-diphosphatase
MRIWEALILGVVQGITEFLPVSSSGHLVLLQKIFGIEEPVLVFDTAVHAGTLIAVLVVLRRDILNILRRIVQPLTLYLIIATIPAVIAALLFKRFIEGAFASGAFLGAAFLLTSALLLLSETLYRRKSTQARGQDKMNWLDALVIGLLQAVAVFPGLSRSGATISAGLFRKLDRDFAARFSFLLSIPAILGALVLQVKNLAGAGTIDAAESTGAGTIGLLPIAIGTISAGVVAFFSIRLALKIVKEHSLVGFALYTGILGIITLVFI